MFLDDVLAINGPLMLVPRSHRGGVIEAGHDTSTTAYPLWTLDNDRVAALVEQGGIVAPTGKAGGLLMFSGNLVHGSAGNITPYPRKIVYLTLNAVSNQIRKPTRPDWIAHQDFAPIHPVRGRRAARPSHPATNRGRIGKSYASPPSQGGTGRGSAPQDRSGAN